MAKILQATTVDGQSFANSKAISEPGAQDITVQFYWTPTSAKYTDGTSFSFLAINQTIELCKMPKGAVLTNYFIVIPDLDSGTTLTLDLGFKNLNSSTQGIKGATAATSNAAIFLAASTVGQAGATVYGTLTTANGYVVPTGLAGIPGLAPLIDDDTFQLLAHAAATGAGSGNLYGWVRYHCRGDVW